MSEQFTSPDNVCRKTLLQIVARGSALLAELQRLHTFIPKIFLEPGKKYQNILYTFEYFKKMNEVEDKIQNDSQLVDLNENIKNTYLPLLDRFYKLFDAIYTYYIALNEFLSEIQTGVFMQYSLQNLFTFQQGKQLMCQGFYLFGVMLLLMDQLIQGPVRERLVLCYYRNKGGENISHINQIIKLVSDTQFRVPQRRTQTYIKPSNYPQDLFARYPFEKQIMESVILAIKDDDIYKQMPAYPQAKYRSFALANQSSMLFVLLFFMPDVLNRAKGTMRQIVDKHFYNTWVIPFYLGYIIDLTQWWKSYKAAKTALNNILDLEGIQQLTTSFVTKQAECYQKCTQYLAEGVMTDQYVTYNLTTMMNILRDSNVTLKWLILHRKTSNEKLREIIGSLSNEVGLLRLMLVTSQFQSLLKQRIINLLEDKQNLWNLDRSTCAQRLKQLSDYFGKAQALGKLQADDSLEDWFGQMSQAVQKISYSNSTYATRKIQAFIKALEDIEQYHQVNSKIQVKTYLLDTRNDLNHMVKVVNIKKTTLIHIEIISDITWSWIALKDYIKLMQKQIRKSPGIALLLKNTFMKLSSILNIPLVRLLQAESPDIDSVSKFYSNQLIRIVKDVLQIIPELVFENLDNIITIFLTKMINEPHKFDKGQLTKYSQFQQRLQIAKLTNQISLFAESILNMQTYLVGVIEVNPKEVLEDGIKKQLIKLIANILQKSLRVQTKSPDEFLNKIIRLSQKLKSFKLSLEYIQDFIHIHGLKMFYEQFQKLIYAYVDMQKLYLVTKEIGFEELNYDESIPMPKGQYRQCNSFLGELLNEIISLTHPSRCTFLQAAYGFFNLQTKKEVISLKTTHILSKCIGICGLQGLDYLLSMKIMQRLKSCIKAMNKVCDEEAAKSMLQKAYSSLKNIGSFSQRYENTLNMLKKSCKNLSDYILSELTEIGQYVLLRDMICLQLRMLGKIGSPRLQLVLKDLNQSILSDMVKNQFVPQTQENQEQMHNDNLILALANPYLSHVGMMQPTKKIYITCKHIESLPIILFTTVSLNILNMDYDNNLKSLIRTKKSTIEPNYFLAGSLCLLQQFHPATKLQYFAYLANYIKSTINFIMINKEVSKNPQLVADLFTYIRFMEQCVKYSKEPYQKYKEIIDLGLFSSLDKQTLKNGYKLN